MKKSMAAALAVCIAVISISISVFAQYGLEVSTVIDPVEEMIIINGTVQSGPDENISVVVYDSSENRIFYDQIISGEEGAYTTVINAKDYEPGEYKVTLKGEMADENSFNFTAPLNSYSPVKLNASVSSGKILLIKDNKPDPDYNKITVSVTNALLNMGELDSSDFTAENLPSGYSFEAEAVNEKTIEFTLTGSGEVTENYSPEIKLNSSLIKSGTANTASDKIGGITIYSESAANTVTLDKYSYNAYMNDEKNVNTGKSTFEAEVLIRNIIKDGVFVKGEDYDFTLPEELNGIKCDVASNIKENKIQIKFSGSTRNNLIKDVEIDDFIIKASAVNGAKNDSEPIKIVFHYASSSGESGSGGGGTGGGGSGTGGSTTSSNGYTGNTNQTVTIIPEIDKEKITFDDTVNHWAENEIVTLASDGIINGVGDKMFEPNRTITRAEFVTLTVKAFNLTETTESSFNDVNDTDWFSTYVKRALKAGIISEDISFRPNDAISREEMVKIIVGAWRLENEEPQWINISDFNDKEEISDWAADYVNTAVTLGLVKGDDNKNFNPKNATTRAEAAVVLYRLLYLN